MGAPNLASPKLGPTSRRWTLAATIVGSSLTFIDGTVVNVALPSLQADLRASITDVQWVIEAYALFVGSLILIGGALGDQFGRKRVFLAGVWVFTAASVACGLAPSMRALIAARAVQGAGAAFLVPGSLAIISATFDESDRGRAIGAWSGFSAITTAIGPVVGGWLIEHVSWRAVFFINVPLAVLVVALSARFMNESRDSSRTGRIDWAGAALAVIGLGAVVFALIEWPKAEGSRLAELVRLAGGCVALAAFIAVERRVASPMLPLWLFSSSAFTLANVLTLLLYGALGVFLWVFPLELIQVQHYSATAAGAALLPFPLLMFALSPWSGGLVKRVGSRLPLTIGPFVAAAGFAMFARSDIDGRYVTAFFPAVVVLALGMVIVVAPLTTTVMEAVEAQHAGVASGVNNAVARVAGLLAIAVLGILLTRTFDARVHAGLDRHELTATERARIDAQLPKLAGADLSSLGPASRAVARQVINEAFTSSFDVVMIAAAGFGAAAACVGWFVRA